MIEDFERCYRAVSSRDPRFDGWFVIAVTSTRIYCRPSCPARTPSRDHVRFYPTAAAAQHAGFRACKRCRPDAAPGSPEWNTRADVVARAMRLIADGTVDREGVPALAARLGYSPRQVHRLLVAEVGVGALALARAQRAQTARILVETTDLPVADVAFSAGFESVRQCNDTFRAVFAMTPTEARRRRPQGRRQAPVDVAGAHPVEGTGGATGVGAGAGTPTGGTIALRLAHRQPCDAAGTIAFLGARAVPGVEVLADGAFHRALRLPHGAGTVSLSPADGFVQAVLHLADLRDVTAAVSRCRRLLDLDSDPAAVDADLAQDPRLRPLVAAHPGRRIPGSVDAAELAVRAVIGQQISVAGARTVAGHLVSACNTAFAPGPGGGGHRLRLFASPDEILSADDAAFRMPASRRRALRALAEALAAGRLDLRVGADPAEVAASLLATPGVGPWTVAYVRMRGLGDPDAFLPSDLGVRRALGRPGHPAGIADATRAAARWRPWRAYATVHLWSDPGGRPDSADRAPGPRPGEADARSGTRTGASPATGPAARARSAGIPIEPQPRTQRKEPAA